MAKKHGRRARKRNSPWVLLALGGALLLVAVLLYFANRGGGDTGGTPAIAADPESIDYGYQKLGTNLTFKIKVTNTGTGTLRFKDKPYIEILEGCWPPDLTIGSMVLRPGESTTVQSSVFMMHEGMDGPHNLGVHLITNDPGNPDLVVSVLSDWGP